MKLPAQWNTLMWQMQVIPVRRDNPAELLMEFKKSLPKFMPNYMKSFIHAKSVISQ